jgi:hypothetical protein
VTEDLAAHEVAARVAIGDLLHTYAFLVDTHKYDDLAQLFTEDGTITDANVGTFTGPHEIVRFFSEASQIPLPEGWPQPRLMRHHLTSTRVRLADEPTATCDAYFVAMTDTRADHWGRYRDSVTLTPAGWRFATRLLVVEGYAEQSWYGARLLSVGAPSSAT